MSKQKEEKNTDFVHTLNINYLIL